MENLNKEQWRDIDGYDGMYQVSDLGRVRSLKFGKVRVLRPVKSKKGYLTIQLHQNNRKTYSIHRLVAQTFIPNDDKSKNQVNHIDECKQNNRIWNLEYCTAQYNATYNGLQYRRHHPKYKLNKVKHLYNPNLTYNENLEIFRENGIECSVRVINSIRKDLGLVKSTKKK